VGAAPGEPGDADDGRIGAPTAWAGQLFLLATASAADVPRALLDDADLTSRPLAWVMHAIGCAVVPVGADDPAVLAFAGLRPDDEPPSLAWRAPTDAERARVAAHTQRWIAVTAARLDPDRREDPAAVVARVARRRGRVLAERGWIDIEMPLDTVDIDVRRAGLDIDPGWLPWLGTVVRFRYV
jgi:hypothetical protein